MRSKRREAAKGPEASQEKGAAQGPEASQGRGAAQKIATEARLSFWEAAGIIVGHGVGAGILSVPYLASRNRMSDFILILAVAYGLNLILHLMVAELSLSHRGAQFIKCFEAELFCGRFKKPASWAAFMLLGFSVLINISGFLIGGMETLRSWFSLERLPALLAYYVLAAIVVLLGMKLVGICEKYSVLCMAAVLLILLFQVLQRPGHELPSRFISRGNVLALYSVMAFSLSAVLSVPQLVKGLQGDAPRIRAAIGVGTAFNLSLIVLLCWMTLYAVGDDITRNGALIDLAGHLGGWVSIVGYLFSLLALSTSFWANSLNLRDVVCEQTGWSRRLSWLCATLPCLGIALLGLGSFVGFIRLAGIVQVLTGFGVILAYARVRRRAPESVICGRFGGLPFQLLVAVSAIAATAGAMLRVQ